MGKRKKRTYTIEQRAEAVKIALGSGKPITQAAKDLDVGVSVLRHWIKQAQIDKAADLNGPLASEERAELAKLRRDHKQLELENAFLKNRPGAAAAPCWISFSVDELRWVCTHLLCTK